MKTTKKTFKWPYVGLGALILLLALVTGLRNIPMDWALPQVNKPEQVRQVYLELSRESAPAADGLSIVDSEEIAWICDQLVGMKLIYSGPYGGAVPYGGAGGDLLTIRMGEKSIYFRIDGTLYTGSSRFTVAKGSEALFQRLVSRYFA